MADDRARWNARYATPAAGPDTPSPWVVGLDALLPRRGRALDVAGGAGRNAVWLAQRGLDVTVVDIAAVGLALARERAARAGVALTTVERDLAAEALPAGPWDVVLVVDYLQRSLFPAYAAALAPDGLLVVAQPTRSNLARHAHPSAVYLLDDGELPRLVAGLEFVQYVEGWTDDGRHVARLVARRPTASRT